MSTSEQEVQQDAVQIEADFSLGIVRDAQRPLIPDGGIYDSADFMLEKPGKAYKRGGWVRHSAVLPDEPSAVFTIHIPTRVGAIVGDDLYDVTSEGAPQAELIGDIGFTVAENPPTYVDRVILCDNTWQNRPKKIYTTGAGGDLTIATLDGTPPYAAHSAVYASRIVLANGGTVAPTLGDQPAYPNRLWFSGLPVETAWDTTNMWLDATYYVTGLAAIQGVLLIFSPRFTERIIGGVPPGVEGENMELQPVGGVGCLDARSIAVIDNQVIFASEEGCFLTNGVGFDNLMEKSDRSGILSYYRSLFETGKVRTCVGGMLMRNYYMLSTRFPAEVDEARVDFMCYLPTKTWWRTTNTWSQMYAIGATEAETAETYSAMAHDLYVARMTPILTPSWSNRQDGNAVDVAPTMTFRTFGQGPGLKAYGFGRLSYDMRKESGTPTLAVAQAVGLEAESFSAVAESPLAATTALDRARFSCFKDSQALNIKLTQSGATSETEVHAIEVESRPYALAGDGE